LHLTVKLVQLSYNLVKVHFDFLFLNELLNLLNFFDTLLFLNFSHWLYYLVVFFLHLLQLTLHFFNFYL